MTYPETGVVRSVRREVEVLRETFQSTGDLLRQATDQLKDGILPGHDAMGAVQVLRSQFSALCADLSLDPSSATLEALVEAAERLESSSVVARRAQLLPHLEQLLSFEHATHQLEEPLSDLRLGVQQLITEASSVKDEVHLVDLESRSRPFLDLLRLASTPDLTEEESSDLQVSAELAVSRLVTIAALKGNLRPASRESGARHRVHRGGQIVDALNADAPSPEPASTDRSTRPGRETGLEALTGDWQRDSDAVDELLRRYPPHAEAHPAVGSRLTHPSGLSERLRVEADGSGELSRGRSDPAVVDTVVVSVEGDRDGTQRSADAVDQATVGHVVPAGEAVVRDGEAGAVGTATLFEAEVPPVEERPPVVDPLDALDDIWLLVDQERLSLAHCLSQAQHALDGRSSVPSWLLAALALGPRVRRPHLGVIGARLSSVFAEHSMDLAWMHDERYSESLALLAAAAALLPSIIAPNTGVISVLRTARDRLQPTYPHLADVLRTANEFCERGDPFDIRRLNTTRDHASWRARRDEMQLEARDWLDRAKHFNMNYAPATAVWLRLLREDEELGRLVRRMIDGQAVDRQDAEGFIGVIPASAGFGDLLDRTFQKVLGKRRRGQEITGSARRALERNAREAAARLEDWIDHHENRPDAPKSFQVQQAEQLRSDLRRLCPAAVGELDHCVPRGPREATGLKYVRDSLDRLTALLEDADSSEHNEPNPDDILYHEIPLCEIEIEASGGPCATVAPEQVLNSVRRVASATPDWLSAFQRRLGTGDTVGAEAALRRIQALDLDGAPELGQQFETELQGLNHQLRIRTERVRQSIEVALALGLMGEAEHVEFNARLDAVETALDEHLPRHNRLKCELLAIEASTDELRTERKSQIERHVQLLGIEPESDAYLRIRSALEESDFVTASEYLYAAIENGSLFDTKVKHRDAFHEFFVERFEAIFDVIRLHQAKLVRSVLKGSVPHGAVDMRNVPKPQAEQAAELLETWIATKREKQTVTLPQRLTTILQHLGFTVDTVQMYRSSQRERGAWYTATVLPIADRNLCPVPQFGSGAHGRYRILCMWDRQGEEDIVNAIGESRHGPPVLVFHFGTVTAARRRTIARLARERKQSTFVVVDDAVILFLCGERGARMPVLFDMLLPFASAEPYTTTASQVPPEMFYGRDQERHALRDPHGSSFVYGGRQLGKTALLRAVEAEAHSPRDGRLAVWIDLKSENIGISRKASDLWPLLIRVLKQHGAIAESLPASSTPARFNQAIRSYLADDPERRILLLLDEADKFLESDAAENFAVTGSIKGLMDVTERRFKVVLAGLHNVQRMTRQVNQPLAHYGDPICVGPLLQNGEVLAARELVRRPLSALGYRFESEDLITRILGQTNYYPSLIQLYCTHLLRHLADAPFNPKTMPPYLVTSAHLDEVYRSRELHKAIRARFQLTLDLDQRYEVLALTIAHMCLDDSRGLVDGYTAHAIRDQALDWWSDGFHSDATLPSFEALLDEMIGLGVLRNCGARRYTLRNRNVMDLMGSRDEIETRLLQEREPEAEFEPLTFRNQVGAGQDGWLSALTAKQESALMPPANGVSCVFGTEAADVDLLNEALQCSGRAVSVIKDAQDARAFGRELDSIAERRKARTAILVDAACPWGEEWVSVAENKMKVLRSQDRFVRVVFAGSPETLRGLRRSSSGWLGHEAEPPVSLGPWHDAAVRTWLATRGYPNLQPHDREELKEVTGFWPGILRMFADASSSDQAYWRRHLEKLAEELGKPGEALAALATFGLLQPEVVDLCFVLASYGEATAEELAALHDAHVPLEFVERELDIGVTLRYVQPTARRSYRVDPVVGRLTKVVRS